MSLGLSFDCFRWQSTYENFRYRYDRRANPYNKGVADNFKEVFCSRIPASKNNFRKKVPKEPLTAPRTVGGGFVSPIMGKAISDIEMGRKPVWNEEGAEQGRDYREHVSNEEYDDGENRMNEEDGDASPGADMSRRLPTESGTDRRGEMLHPRRSSWGRRSGSLTISPEVVALAAAGVGDSRRVTVTDGNHSFETQKS